MDLISELFPTDDPNKPLLVTLCRDCIFATWNGNTQEDCILGRIDKLEKNGAEIIGLDNGEKRFFVIKDRLCTTCRNSDWGKKRPKRKWKEDVFNEIQVKVDMVVFFEDHHTKLELEETIHSILWQTIPPHSLSVITSESRAPIAVNSLRYSTTCPWKVDTSLKEVLKRQTGMYYGLFHAGCLLPLDFIAEINEIVNHDVEQLIMIEPDDTDNGRVVFNTKGKLSVEDLYTMGARDGNIHLIKKLVN